MMTVPFLDLRGQYAQLRDELLARFDAVCASGRFVLGPAVEEFETAFAAYCQVRYCVGLNTGTSALHLALRCLNVGPGDEVITVPLTFVATTWAVSYVGATPIFVDIDPVTRTLDPKHLQASITPRTRAIILVHLYGMPADLVPIRRIAEKHGLPVVEDAAQAHGAIYEGKRVGGFGRAACFSFYPAKNLGACGEGGALVTDDAALAEQARALRDHGQRVRYQHETVGYNYRMDELQGAALAVKLKHLDDWNAARRRHAAHYLRCLAEVEGIGLPTLLDDRESVFHLFVVEVDERARVMQALQDAGVQTGVHYPIPVHLQPAYAHLGLGAGRFPVAERLARRCLSLPLFPEMTGKQIEYVCEHLARAVRSTPLASVAAH